MPGGPWSRRGVPTGHRYTPEVLNFSPEKILVIGILALLVLGPDRLPAAARTAGRVLGELRRMGGSLQGELHEALAEPRDALEHAARELGLDGARRGPLSPGRWGAPRTDAPAPGAPSAPVAATPPAGRSATAPGEPPAPDDPALN